MMIRSMPRCLTSLTPVAAAAALLFAANACSTTTVPPLEGVACSDAEVAGPSLVYPAPGATGVPTGVGELIIGRPATGAYTLVPMGKAPIALGSPGPVPSPEPATVPTPSPMESYAAIALPPLAAGTTYSVAFSAPNRADGCPAQIEQGTYGMFTTE